MEGHNAAARKLMEKLSEEKVKALKEQADVHNATVTELTEGHNAAVRKIQEELTGGHNAAVRKIQEELFVYFSEEKVKALKEQADEHNATVTKWFAIERKSTL